jgi:hypothetical protein
MDLYRWAEKLSPWVSTPLLAETLELAWQARIIDSRASPYDLRPVGLQPIAVETEDGRQEFVAAQQRILAIATPLRRALIAEYDRVLHWMDYPRMGHEADEGWAEAESRPWAPRTAPGGTA